MSVSKDINNELSVRSEWKYVHGWANTRRALALVTYPRTIEECLEVVKFSKKNNMTICPRGGGFTFGDMILNDGQVILDVSQMNDIISWDPQTGKLTVQPGVNFSSIFKVAMPANWTLPSCPGGLLVTVGGAISNNVHGKDAWNNGVFGNQVIEFKFLTANGDLLCVNRDKERVLFESIVGGMGLLGIIVEVTLQLQKVPSPFVEVSSYIVRNIEESLEMLERLKDHSDFLLTWVDAFATGDSLGRGIVASARWLEKDEKINEDKFVNSLTPQDKIFGLFPANLTWACVRPFFQPYLINILNKIFYNASKFKNKIYWKPASIFYTDYNFIQDRLIPDKPQLYYPHGYIEFQPLIPKSSGVKAVRSLFKLCQDYRFQSQLCALKTHKNDNYLICFEGEGYSIGVDVQLKNRDLSEVEHFARTIFDYVIDCGGKVYLAKDEYLSHHEFVKMYPRYRDFLNVKSDIDQDSLFSSNLYRRVINPG